MSRTEEIATAGGRSSRQLTPRRTTYLDPKGGRDSSMLLKQGVAEDVYAPALQRLRDRVRAGLPQSQSPGVEDAHSSVARLYADARESQRFDFRRGYALLTGRCPMRVLKGMNGGPTSRSTRSLVTEQGMAYGARALKLRSPNSSRGRNAPPGRTGEPSAGRSGTGASIPRNLEVRERRIADTVLSSRQDRGQEWACALEQESLESGLRSKDLRAVRRGAVGKGPEGTSLVAYSTRGLHRRQP